MGKRIYCAVFAVFFLGGEAAAQTGPDAKLLFPSEHPDRVILNLTENPETSVAVNWRTDTTRQQGKVEVAVATGGPDFVKSTRTLTANTERLKTRHEEEPEVVAYYHSAVIDQLEPGGQYVYRVGDEGAWSEWYQFSMPDPENKGLSFLYFGDAQNQVKSMWSRVAREAWKHLPRADFMLHAGDLINRHDRDIEWGEWFYAGSPMHAMIPSVMTPGNHEYGKGVVLSPQWRPQFNLPENGPPGLEETCYQVNFSDVKVVSLDAEQIDESAHYEEQQVRWLDSLLTDDPRSWTVVTLHYPLFSTAPNRDMPRLRERFKPIFDKHKVDIVLQGHDHAYGRGRISNVPAGSQMNDRSSGTMYVVSVAGPKMYELSDRDWMDRKAADTQLFQTITIQGQELIYRAFTATGNLYDSFILQKDPGGPNKLINEIPDETTGRAASKP